MQTFGRNRYGPKLGGCAPLGEGEVGLHLTVWPGPRPTCMPSFVLIRPTVWPQYTNVTQTSQTAQGTDSIGRTVLQTVAQKLKPGLVISYDIQLGNREGLLWFWHCINLSLTYLDTYPLTYSPGPRCYKTCECRLTNVDDVCPKSRKLVTAFEDVSSKT